MPSLAGSSIWQLPQVSPPGVRWIWPTSFSVSPCTFFKRFTTKYLYRTRNDCTGIRFDKECISQPFPTLCCLLGRCLDTFLHLRQRLRRLLGFQCYRFPHSLYVHTLCFLSSLHGWLWFLPLSDINIPIFVVLYFGYKIIMRTKIWKPTEMDFVTVSLD